MHVEALYISPVKSLGLQRVERASITKTGLRGDRQFFLVSDRNRLFTMREYGPLAFALSSPTAPSAKASPRPATP